MRAPRTGTELSGRDAVRTMYAPVIRYDDGTPRTKHVLSNLEVTVDEGAGHGTSRCVFTVWQAPPGQALRPVLAGRYDDTFTRDDGTWRFTERIIHADLLGDLARHMRRR